MIDPPAVRRVPTIGDVDTAVARYANPNISYGLLTQPQILSEVVHTLSLGVTRAEELTTWTADDWAALFAVAFRSDDGSLRLAIIRALAEVRP